MSCANINNKCFIVSKYLVIFFSITIDFLSCLVESRKIVDIVRAFEIFISTHLAARKTTFAEYKCVNVNIGYILYPISIELVWRLLFNCTYKWMWNECKMCHDFIMATWQSSGNSTLNWLAIIVEVYLLKRCERLFVNKQRQYYVL